MSTPAPPPEVSAEALPMRRRLPKNYLRLLVQRTGADKTTLWTVVKEERTGSRYWPAVLQLARLWAAASGNELVIDEPTAWTIEAAEGRANG